MNKQKGGIIILSRFSSTRLPGKALRLVGNKKLLDHIIDRLLLVFSKTEIILATSEDASDDVIVDFAISKGIQFYRGSLSIVAERFLNAASAFNLDFAVRINGDNLLLDPYLIDECIQLFKEKKSEFLSNVKGRTFPKGMSIEIVNTTYYKKHLPAILKDSYFYEHVMTFFYQFEDQERHQFVFNNKFPLKNEVDLSLDEQADVDKTEWMLEKLNDKVDIASTLNIYYEYEKYFSR